MTRHFAAQHEARSDQMVALTRQCIVALDAGDHFPGVPLVGGDGPTPIYDATRSYLVAKEKFAKARLQSLVVLPPDPVFDLDDGPELVDIPWLPVLGWLFFAGFVALLVWAVTT